MRERQTMDRDAMLHYDTWAGRTSRQVRVIDETPRRYRIRAMVPTPLGPLGRTLAAGETALVPKHNVTFTTSEA